MEFDTIIMKLKRRLVKKKICFFQPTQKVHLAFANCDFFFFLLLNLCPQMVERQYVLSINVKLIVSVMVLNLLL